MDTALLLSVFFVGLLFISGYPVIFIILFLLIIILAYKNSRSGDLFSALFIMTILTIGVMYFMFTDFSPLSSGNCYAVYPKVAFGIALYPIEAFGIIIMGIVGLVLTYIRIIIALGIRPSIENITPFIAEIIIMFVIFEALFIPTCFGFG